MAIHPALAIAGFKLPLVLALALSLQLARISTAHSLRYRASGFTDSGTPPAVPPPFAGPRYTVAAIASCVARACVVRVLCTITNDFLG